MDSSYYGLVLYEDERDELLKLCLREDIPISYPDMFSKEYPMTYMWVFSTKGIGGASTIVMHHMSKNRLKIIHGVKELKQFFNTDEWKSYQR